MIDMRSGGANDLGECDQEPKVVVDEVEGW